nr:hypothetical protein [Tanacetum cinerariifolium]
MLGLIKAVPYQAMSGLRLQVIVGILSTREMITLNEIDQSLLKLEIVCIDRWYNNGIFAKLLIKGVFVNDPCERMRANENKGGCQVGLRAKSHGVLGRVDCYCSGRCRKLKDGGEVLKLKNLEKDESKSYQDNQSRKITYSSEEMAYTSSGSSTSSNSDSEVSTCSKACLKAVENLKSTNEKLLTDLRKYLAKAEKEGIQLNVNKLENASKSLNKIIECQIVDNCKKGLGYNAVSPPHTGLLPPPKSYLSFIGKGSDALIIEDWVLDDEEEKVEKKEVKLSIKRIKFVKATIDNNPRVTVKNEDRLKIKELMELCTKLSDSVLDLKKTKTAQAKEIANLKNKVKKLERKRRFRTQGMNLFKIGTSRRRILGKDDASKQERNLKQMLIFEEMDFDVQAMRDADYALAARVRAKEQRIKPLTKSQKRNQT